MRQGQKVRLLEDMELRGLEKETLEKIPKGEYWVNGFSIGICFLAKVVEGEDFLRKVPNDSEKGYYEDYREDDFCILSGELKTIARRNNNGTTN